MSRCNHHFSGQFIPVLNCSHGEDFFSWIQTEFALKLLMPIDIFCHWASLWRRYPDVPCNYLLGVGKLWLDPPWDVSSLRWMDPIPSTVLHMSSSPTLWSFWDPLWDTLQPSCISLQLGGTQLDAVFQVLPKKCQVELSNHLPWPAHYTLDVAAQEVVSPSCCWGTYRWLKFSFQFHFKPLPTILWAQEYKIFSTNCGPCVQAHF